MEIKLNHRLKINVGGEKFEILQKNITKIKKGRLWKIINTQKEFDLKDLCDDYNLEESEVFFDRDPSLFNFILNYYRVGRLHINECLCPVVLNNELIYWDLDQPLMDVCCLSYFCISLLIIESIFVKIFSKTLEIFKRFFYFKICCEEKVSVSGF